MKSKAKILKELEYQVKLFQLRVKYSRSVWELIGLSMQLFATINQLRIVQSQPMPKYPSGVAIVGRNKKEVIIDKNGKQYKL